MDIGYGGTSIIMSGCEITYGISPQVIHVVNNSELKKFYALKGSKGIAELAATLLSIYKDQAGKAIDITVLSLTAEIIGHIDAGYIGGILKAITGKDIRNIVRSTNIIDCGEKSVDSNRTIWDAITLHL
jgi:hypothetical protein